MSRRYQLEHNAQVAVFQWAKLNEGRCPELALLYANPNGGYRNISVARYMKAEGLKAGVPDMFLPVARGGYHGLFIELKQAGARPKSETAKGSVSDEQRQWLKALREQYYLAEVCYGATEAIDLLKDYLGK